jgi:hypothetical protein
MRKKNRSVWDILKPKGVGYMGTFLSAFIKEHTNG